MSALHSAAASPVLLQLSEDAQPLPALSVACKSGGSSASEDNALGFEQAPAELDDDLVWLASFLSASNSRILAFASSTIFRRVLLA
jgi:hypothetical protein